MLHDFIVILFAMTAGFTASGIVANLYRILAGTDSTGFGRTVYYATMVVAGPSVLYENAAKAHREKSCSRLAFWLAAAIAGYWSLALGLFVLEFALAV
jgi:hypothetical protein